MVGNNNTTQLEYQDLLYLITLYESGEPTVEQHGAAIAHCRALSYWRGITDPEVRIGYKGGHKL
jgi:hypothetical protein